MTRTSFVQPPRAAAWLIELFTPYEQMESIPGDLLEEFAEVTSKSGIASARRWYWRQSGRTIAHLIGSEFRHAPWSIAGAIIVGILLVQLGHAPTERTIWAFIHFDRYHIEPHFHPLSRLHLFFVRGGMMGMRIVVATFIGSIVALGSKGREMVATIALSLIYVPSAVLGFWRLAQSSDWYKALFPMFMFYVGGLIAIVVGGGIVRKYRSAMHPHVSA